MNEWVMKGFDQTCVKLGVSFGRVYYESATYKFGRTIVEKGLADGIFQKEPDGAVIYQMPEAEFGLDPRGKPKRVTLLRADGTSLYITQDFGTAVMKVEEYALVRSIYVVGSEQEYHFKCLFHILRRLGYEWAEQCYHLSYGMVTLPDGKMKSREGRVVDADDLAEEMVELAKAAILKKHQELDADEVLRRARVIGLGALRFYLLFDTPTNTIAFDPTVSISFDGTTGPYCQYAVARARAILHKAAAEGKFPSHEQASLVFLEERALLHQVMRLTAVIQQSATELNPSVLAKHLFELAKAFSVFYNKVPVLAVAESAFAPTRLMLVDIAQKAITGGLSLLGIDTLNEM